MLKLVANGVGGMGGGHAKKPTLLARMIGFLIASGIKYEIHSDVEKFIGGDTAKDLKEIKLSFFPDEAKRFFCSKYFNPLIEFAKERLIYWSTTAPAIEKEKEMRFYLNVMKRFAGELRALPPIEEFIFTHLPLPRLKIELYFHPDGSPAKFSFPYAEAIHLCFGLVFGKYRVIKQEKDRIVFSFNNGERGKDLSYGFIQINAVSKQLVFVSVRALEAVKPVVSVSYFKIRENGIPGFEYNADMRDYFTREDYLRFSLPILEIYGQGVSNLSDHVIDKIASREGPGTYILKPLGHQGDETAPMSDDMIGTRFERGNLRVLFWGKKLLEEIDALVKE